MENPFLRYKMFFTIKLAFVIFFLCILVYFSLSTFFLPFFSNPVQKNDLFLINNTGNQSVGRNPAELAGLPDSQNGGRYFWHLADGQIVSIYPPMGNCHNMSIAQLYNIENYVMIFEKDGLDKQCTFQLEIDTDKKIEGMVRQQGGTSLTKNKKYASCDSFRAPVCRSHNFGWRNRRG
jgi:hypothetical protein